MEHDHNGEHEHKSVPLDGVNLSAEKPVHVFVVKSNMSPTNIEDILPDEVKAMYQSEKMPEVLKTKMREAFAKVSAAHGAVHNYVSFMLTVDSAGVYRAYSTQANERNKNGTIERKRAPDTKGLCLEMSSEDDCLPVEMIRSNMQMNESMYEMRQAMGDWHGKVEMLERYEGENTMQDAIAAIGRDMWDTLYPPAAPTVSPVQRAEVEAAKPLTKENRAKLVAKFGEKAIKDLEKRMHGSKAKKV